MNPDTLLSDVMALRAQELFARGWPLLPGSLKPSGTPVVHQPGPRVTPQDLSVDVDGICEAVSATAKAFSDRATRITVADMRHLLVRHVVKERGRCHDGNRHELVASASGLATEGTVEEALLALALEVSTADDGRSCAKASAAATRLVDLSLLAVQQQQHAGDSSPQSTVSAVSVGNDVCDSLLHVLSFCVTRRQRIGSGNSGEGVPRVILALLYLLGSVPLRPPQIEALLTALQPLAVHVDDSSHASMATGTDASGSGGGGGCEEEEDDNVRSDESNADVGRSEGTDPRAKRRRLEPTVSFPVSETLEATTGQCSREWDGVFDARTAESAVICCEILSGDARVLWIPAGGRAGQGTPGLPTSLPGAAGAAPTALSGVASSPSFFELGLGVHEFRSGGYLRASLSNVGQIRIRITATHVFEVNPNLLDELQEAVVAARATAISRLLGQLPTPNLTNLPVPHHQRGVSGGGSATSSSGGVSGGGAGGGGGGSSVGLSSHADGAASVALLLRGGLRVASGRSGGGDERRNGRAPSTLSSLSSSATNLHARTLVVDAAAWSRAVGGLKLPFANVSCARALVAIVSHLLSVSCDSGDERFGDLLRKVQIQSDMLTFVSGIEAEATALWILDNILPCAFPACSVDEGNKVAGSDVGVGKCSLSIVEAIDGAKNVLAMGAAKVQHFLEERSAIASSYCRALDAFLVLPKTMHPRQYVQLPHTLSQGFLRRGCSISGGGGVPHPSLSHLHYLWGAVGSGMAQEELVRRKLYAAIDVLFRLVRQVQGSAEFDRPHRYLRNRSPHATFILAVVSLLTCEMDATDFGALRETISRHLFDVLPVPQEMSRTRTFLLDDSSEATSATLQQLRSLADLAAIDDIWSENVFRSSSISGAANGSGSSGGGLPGLSAAAGTAAGGLAGAVAALGSVAAAVAAAAAAASAVAASVAGPGAAGAGGGPAAAASAAAAGAGDGTLDLKSGDLYVAQDGWVPASRPMVALEVTPTRRAGTTTLYFGVGTKESIAAFSRSRVAPRGLVAVDASGSLIFHSDPLPVQATRTNNINSNANSDAAPQRNTTGGDRDCESDAEGGSNVRSGSHGSSGSGSDRSSASPSPSGNAPGATSETVPPPHATTAAPTTMPADPGATATTATAAATASSTATGAGPTSVVAAPPPLFGPQRKKWFPIRNDTPVGIAVTSTSATASSGVAVVGIFIDSVVVASIPLRLDNGSLHAFVLCTGPGGCSVSTNFGPEFENEMRWAHPCALESPTAHLLAFCASQVVGVLLRRCSLVCSRRAGVAALAAPSAMAVVAGGGAGGSDTNPEASAFAEAIGSKLVSNVWTLSQTVVREPPCDAAERVEHGMVAFIAESTLLIHVASLRSLARCASDELRQSIVELLCDCCASRKGVFSPAVRFGAVAVLNEFASSPSFPGLRRTDVVRALLEEIAELHSPSAMVWHSTLHGDKLQVEGSLISFVSRPSSDPKQLGFGNALSFRATRGAAACSSSPTLFSSSSSSSWTSSTSSASFDIRVKRRNAPVPGTLGRFYYVGVAVGTEATTKTELLRDYMTRCPLNSGSSGFFVIPDTVVPGASMFGVRECAANAANWHSHEGNQLFGNDDVVTVRVTRQPDRVTFLRNGLLLATIAVDFPCDAPVHPVVALFNGDAQAELLPVFDTPGDAERCCTSLLREIIRADGSVECRRLVADVIERGDASILIALGSDDFDAVPGASCAPLLPTLITALHKLVPQSAAGGTSATSAPRLLTPPLLATANTDGAPQSGDASTAAVARSVSSKGNLLRVAEPRFVLRLLLLLGRIAPRDVPQEAAADLVSLLCSMCRSEDSSSIPVPVDAHLRKCFRSCLPSVEPFANLFRRSASSSGSTFAASASSSPGTGVVVAAVAAAAATTDLAATHALSATTLLCPVSLRELSACDPATFRYPLSRCEVVHSILHALGEHREPSLTFSGTWSTEDIEVVLAIQPDGRVEGKGQDTRGEFTVSGTLKNFVQLDLTLRYAFRSDSADEADGGADGAGGSGEGGADGDGGSDEWACDACTFLNPSSATRCGICNNRKAGATWVCPQCTYAFTAVGVDRCEMCAFRPDVGRPATAVVNTTAACRTCGNKIEVATIETFSSAQPCSRCGAAATPGLFVLTSPHSASIFGRLTEDGDAFDVTVEVGSLKKRSQFKSQSFSLVALLSRLETANATRVSHGLGRAITEADCFRPLRFPSHDNNGELLSSTVASVFGVGGGGRAGGGRGGGAGGGGSRGGGGGAGDDDDDGDADVDGALRQLFEGVAAPVDRNDEDLGPTSECMRHALVSAAKVMLCRWLPAKQTVKSTGELFDMVVEASGCEAFGTAVSLFTDETVDKLINHSCAVAGSAAHSSMSPLYPSFVQAGCAVCRLFCVAVEHNRFPKQRRNAAIIALAQLLTASSGSVSGVATVVKDALHALRVLLDSDESINASCLYKLLAAAPSAGTDFAVLSILCRLREPALSLLGVSQMVATDLVAGIRCIRRGLPLPAVFETNVSATTPHLIPLPQTKLSPSGRLIVGQVQGSTGVKLQHGGRHYYEVVVPDCGVSTYRVAMGWGTKTHAVEKATNHVGHDMHSWAYTLRASVCMLGGEIEYVPPGRLGPRDVVGSLLDLDKRQVCWSLNGIQMPFLDIPTGIGETEDIYPFVSANLGGESMEICLFGTKYLPPTSTDFDPGERVPVKAVVATSPQSLAFYRELSSFAEREGFLHLSPPTATAVERVEAERRALRCVERFPSIAQALRTRFGALTETRSLAANTSGGGGNCDGHGSGEVLDFLFPYLAHLSAISEMALIASPVVPELKGSSLWSLYCEAKELFSYAARWSVVEQHLSGLVNRSPVAIVKVTLDRRSTLLSLGGGGGGGGGMVASASVDNLEAAGRRGSAGGDGTTSPSNSALTAAAAAAAAATTAVPAIASPTSLGAGGAGGDSGGPGLSFPAPFTPLSLSASVFGQLLRALRGKDVFRNISMFTAVFKDTIAEDNGGLYRSAFSLISEELMFRRAAGGTVEQPRLPLFVKNDHSTFVNVVPNTRCTTPEDLEAFTFLGKLCGNATLTGSIVLALSLPRIVWKFLLDEASTLEDYFFDCCDSIRLSLESDEFLLDDDYFFEIPGIRSRWTPAPTCCESAVTSSGGGGGDKGVDVGSSALALLQQQDEVARRRKAAEAALLHQYDTQLGALRRGFLCVIPSAALTEMTPHDLERRVCGQADLSAAELLGATDLSLLPPVTREYFETAVENMSNADRSSLLLFVSGQSRLPLLEKIKVYCGDEEIGVSIPQAHTCTPISLKLQPYSSVKAMEEKLYQAMSNSYEYGFV